MVWFVIVINCASWSEKPTLKDFAIALDKSKLMAMLSMHVLDELVILVGTSIVS
jgi:hypothetical protein